jgi:archaellum component FlaF (FlaF/FlaG flagellin family)
MGFVVFVQQVLPTMLFSVVVIVLLESNGTKMQINAFQNAHNTNNFSMNNVFVSPPLIKSRESVVYALPTVVTTLEPKFVNVTTVSPKLMGNVYAGKINILMRTTTIVLGGAQIVRIG